MQSTQQREKGPRTFITMTLLSQSWEIILRQHFGRNGNNNKSDAYKDVRCGLIRDGKNYSRWQAAETGNNRDTGRQRCTRLTLPRSSRCLGLRQFCFFFKLTHFWERERKWAGESQRDRERERQRERILSRLCTVSTEPYTGLEPRTPRSWPELNSRVEHSTGWATRGALIIPVSSTSATLPCSRKLTPLCWLMPVAACVSSQRILPRSWPFWARIYMYTESGSLWWN